MRWAQSRANSAGLFNHTNLEGPLSGSYLPVGRDFPFLGSSVLGAHETEETIRPLKLFIEGALEDFLTWRAAGDVAQFGLQLIVDDRQDCPNL